MRHKIISGYCVACGQVDVLIINMHDCPGPKPASKPRGWQVRDEVEMVHRTWIGPKPEAIAVNLSKEWQDAYHAALRKSVIVIQKGIAKPPTSPPTPSSPSQPLSNGQKPGAVRSYPRASWDIDYSPTLARVRLAE